MTAPIQAVIRGCASKLEALLGTEIPPDLGINALPNQCQRRLYKFRNLLNDIERVVQKIEDNLGLANEYIGKLSRDNAIRKETEMQELMQELQINEKQRAADVLIPNLKDKIEALEERLDITHNTDGDTNSGTVPLSRSVPMRKNLPKTELKRFDGSPSQWIPFWDYFRTIIHEDSQVPKIDKFSYLDSCIEGKASAIIQGIPISESGYDDAIDLLLKTYGETKRLIRTLNRELMSLPISESFEDDESLYLKSEKIFRQLISMNQNVEDGMYYSNLEGKMSPEVLDKYCIIKDAEDNDDWDTSKFRNAFSRALDQIKHRQELRKNVIEPKRDRHEQTMSFTAFSKNDKYQGRNKFPQRNSDQSPPRGRKFEPRKFRDQRHDNSDSSVSHSPMRDRRNSPYPKRDWSSSPEREKWKKDEQRKCQLCQGEHSARPVIGQVNAL
ncbi:hypothetical protein niasHT_013150 [Heterodera trifolii]|uniref:Uncharacterized protein n=1 Tax=Heterodera trifolii TaxID=157864 RepID=A0ABD2LA97_9BILA